MPKNRAIKLYKCSYHILIAKNYLCKLTFDVAIKINLGFRQLRALHPDEAKYSCKRQFHPDLSERCRRLGVLVIKTGSFWSQQTLWKMQTILKCAELNGGRCSNRMKYAAVKITVWKQLEQYWGKQVRMQIAVIWGLCWKKNKTIFMQSLMKVMRKKAGDNSPTDCATRPNGNLNKERKPVSFSKIPFYHFCLHSVSEPLS